MSGVRTDGSETALDFGNMILTNTISSYSDYQNIDSPAATSNNLIEDGKYAVTLDNFPNLKKDPHGFENRGGFIFSPLPKMTEARVKGAISDEIAISTSADHGNCGPESDGAGAAIWPGLASRYSG